VHISQEIQPLISRTSGLDQMPAFAELTESGFGIVGYGEARPIYVISKIFVNVRKYSQQAFMCSI